MQAVHTDVRGHLAHVTHDIHQALHLDPVLSRLMHPDLTASGYVDALAVFADLYTAVEGARQRMQVFPDLSLARECRSLRMDLTRNRRALPDAPRWLHLECEGRVLGALYVAHGASFGRNSMRANILNTLPCQSHRFVGLAPDAGVWKTLLGALSQHGQDPAHLRRIEDGARLTFELVLRLSQSVEMGR